MWQPFRRLSSFRPWPAEEEQKIIGSSKFLTLVCDRHLSRVLGRSSSAQNCLSLSRWVINLLFACASVWAVNHCPADHHCASWPALKKRVLIVGSSHARRLDRFMGSENGKARPAVRVSSRRGASVWPGWNACRRLVGGSHLSGIRVIPASRSHTADRWQWRPVNWRFGPHCAPASGSGRHIETPFRPGTRIYHPDPSQVH